MHDDCRWRDTRAGEVGRENGRDPAHPDRALREGVARAPARVRRPACQLGVWARGSFRCGAEGREGVEKTAGKSCCSVLHSAGGASHGEGKWWAWWREICKKMLAKSILFV
jgi:hypothetical protein